MQYTEGNLGRVFALRLEHGDPMPQTLEDFVQAHGINSGLAFMVGGAQDASRLVVGPADSDALPFNPMETALTGAHEVVAVGMVFPHEDGKPRLHMHAACGREQGTITGCIRAGIVTWHVLELVIIEITGLSAARRYDPATDFNLLQCQP